MKKTSNKKAKKKAKKTFKRNIFLVVSTMLVCIGAFAVLLYKRKFFRGEVKDKYQSSTPFQALTVNSNHIVVKSWFGEKDFCVDDETFESVLVGEEYSFKRENIVSWVKLQDKQKVSLEQEDIEENLEENLEEN